ncbi:phosphoglycerate dehydrogenase (plasmid) [Lichenicola cladoniae]|uniref:Phosphoglycerate dehydrogenase n=1 Tax=Lichenicola cladoniae TaxID=1484109 RepID=A0A6M8HYK7_9PROT|nr:phosphoglycerate dehydrogenase [Lichenicola cladoniae]NPD67821.1 phosphoglycerate dehydrogenase [Acetobacteraceae bacterium]QKE93336.1 phosphoglycerate dehydrogenase [Lichenicola cladoniae]
MNRILVTPRSLTRNPDPALLALEEDGYTLVFSSPGETPDEAALLSLLPGCVGWLAGVEPVSPRVLEAAHGLRVISRNGTGSDNLPLETAERLGIMVLRAAGANARGVAELAIGLAMGALRHVPEQSAALKGGVWQRRPGLEIEGRTLGLIGCGAIGRLVAKFALALDARVRVYDPYPDHGFTPSGDFAWIGLKQVLEEADIVSLHCPIPPDGTAVLDASAIGRLRSGCVVVNTARAALVDDTAMLDALQGGGVGVYATDVFAVEPPPPSALLAHPRVIATPHIGGLTDESVRRATVAAVENLRGALRQPWASAMA